MIADTRLIVALRAAKIGLHIIVATHSGDP